MSSSCYHLTSFLNHLLLYFLQKNKHKSNKPLEWEKSSCVCIYMCGCVCVHARVRERERERDTYCWWGCVWFRSSRPLNSYSNTRFRNATNRERKNNKPFHSISHFFINNQGGIIRRNKILVAKEMQKLEGH